MSGIALSSLRTLCHASIFTSALLLSSAGAALHAQQSDDAAGRFHDHHHETGGYTRIATIAVPGNPLKVYDISFADRRLPLYYLADRSNAGLDIFDAGNNTFLTRVEGFVGLRTTNGAANNDISGPDGVQAVGLGEIWVGDGDSSVKVVDLRLRQVVDTISTIRTDEPGHTAATDKRADEMTYDPKDKIIAIANDAATPPFISFISTDPKNRKVLGRIVYQDAVGIEQSVYDPNTGLIYVNLPQVGADPNNGAVSVIDPVRQVEINRFPNTGCGGAGLALGPDQNLLIGCGLTNFSMIINTLDGNPVAQIPQVSGSDEVWYNRGDHNYYLAAEFNPADNGGPSLGIIDARTNTFVQNVPTFAGAHSVAADPRNNHIFVPLGPNPTDPECLNGCIGVYALQDDRR